LEKNNEGSVETRASYIIDEEGIIFSLKKGYNNNISKVIFFPILGISYHYTGFQ